MIFDRTGQLVEHTLNGQSQPLQQPQAIHVTLKEWPFWAKALKQFATPEDRGIGDVVARMIGDENSEAFKAWYLATFKKPCGCKGRETRWNQMYPFT